MRVLFFSSTYWGHISLCLGMAKSLIANGIQCYFGFIVPPKKWITETIQSLGVSVIYDISLLKEYLGSRSLEIKILLEHKIREHIIMQVNPDLIITDGDDCSIIAAKLLNKRVVKVRRTNLLESVSHDIRTVYKHSIIKTKYSIWGKYVETNNIVPHPRNFLTINNESAKYFRPSWANPLNNIIDESEVTKFDILILPSTAGNFSEITIKLIEILKKYGSLKIAVCGGNMYDYSDVKSFAFGNIEHLISKSKIIITFGGHGAIVRGIMSNKPQIVIDIGTEFSQYYAYGLEQANSGIFLHQSDLDNDLIDAVSEIWSNYYYYKSNITSLAGQFLLLPSIVEVVNIIVHNNQ